MTDAQTGREQSLQPSRALTLLALFLLLATLFFGFHRRTVDADVLWHLRTGQLIVETGSIPHHDPYSANAQGADWVGQEWLWQPAAFGIWEVAGWQGLSAARLLLIAGTLGCCMVAGRRRGASVAGFFLAGSVMLCPLMAFGEIRPHLASFLLFGFTLMLLNEGKCRPMLLLFLLPLNVLWANLHGAYLNGWLVMAITFAGWLVEPRFSQDAKTPRGRAAGQRASAPPRLPLVLRGHPFTRQLLVLGLVGILSPITAIATPFGVDSLTFAIRVVSVPFFRANVYEWAPVRLSREFIPFFAVLTVVTGCAWAARRRLTPGDWLLLVVYAAMSLRMRRQIAFFSIALLPTLAAATTALLETASTSADTGKPEQRRIRVPVPVRRILAVLLAAGTVSGSFSCFAGARGRLGAGLEPGRFPSEAVLRLSRARAGGVVFNDYNDGGYLIWRLWPEWKVCMDGRIDVYGEQNVRAHAFVWAGGAGWNDLLDLWKANAILGRYEVARALPRHNLYHELARDTRWAPVYWDDQSILYLRLDDTTATAILKPYHRVHPGLCWQEIAALQKSEADWQSLGNELERANAEFPGCRRTREILRRYRESAFPAEKPGPGASIR